MTIDAKAFDLSRRLDASRLEEPRLAQLVRLTVELWDAEDARDAAQVRVDDLREVRNAVTAQLAGLDR